MQRIYTLDPLRASFGRTLWQNLIGGNGTWILEEHKDYTRITSPDKTVWYCEFRHSGGADITLMATNNVVIKSDTEAGIRDAESSLKKICEDKGCPLVDLSSLGDLVPLSS